MRDACFFLRARVWLLTAAIARLGLVAVIGQGAGIRPVTEQDVAEAIALGRGDGSIDHDPLLARLGTLRHQPEKAASYPGPRDEEEMRRVLHDTPFRFIVRSPYSRIAALVRAWHDSPQRFPLPSAGALNEELVVVEVRPGTNLETADEVQQIFLRRGGNVLHAVRGESHGRTTMKSGRLEKSFRDGTFTFPFEAFAPVSDLTIVIVGTKRTFEWTIAREELAAMR